MTELIHHYSRMDALGEQQRRATMIGANFQGSQLGPLRVRARFWRQTVPSRLGAWRPAAGLRRAGDGTPAGGPALWVPAYYPVKNPMTTSWCPSGATTSHVMSGRLSFVTPYV